MRLRTLDIFLGKRPVGQLFQYGEGGNAVTRLIPDAAFWNDSQAPTLSLATAIDLPAEREAFWRGYINQPFFNGQGSQLPCFFQNLLPEGALLRHLAELRGCSPGDHFEMLAACGTDLPGAVYALPATLQRGDVARIVVQNNDTLEVTVTADPMQGATSLSGIQPKLSLVMSGGRYAARTKNASGMHIIAKLPTVDYPLLPEVEELSLRMAAAAGVAVAQAHLVPLAQIDTELPFLLGASAQFLAVQRFDREHGSTHIHCEDFAQVLSVLPDNKYTDPAATYALMARVMLATPGLNETAILELLRRITVNELLGNFDAHVKNFGVIYRDGQAPTLSPAYDVVAYAAYLGGRGHALRFTPDSARQARLTPAVLRAWSRFAGFSEVRAGAAVRETVKRACQQWPGMITGSTLLDAQKQRLLMHFEGVPLVQSYRAGADRAKAA